MTYYRAQLIQIHVGMCVEGLLLWIFITNEYKTNWNVLTIGRGSRQDMMGMDEKHILQIYFWLL